MALIVAVSLPLLAALLCWVKPLRSIAWGITVFCLTISFAMAVMSCRAGSSQWKCSCNSGLD